MHELIKKANIAGIITAVITLIISCVLNFIFTKGTMTVDGMGRDVALSVFITALVCAIIQYFMLKNNVSKGKIDSYIPNGDQASYLEIPKNGPVFLVLISFFAWLIFACAPVGIWMTLVPEMEMSRICYIILKSALAALGGGYAVYHANLFVPALLLEKKQNK